MNIEVRAVGKRKKYYLAHSFREGKKSKKIRRYLGKDLSENKLEILRKRAEEILKQQIETYKIIRNPLKFELTEKEKELINELVGKIDFNLIKLSEDEWRLFTELFTYNTNAIEGSEVKREEVKKILEENKWPKDVKKGDVAETYGVAEAVNYIRKTKDIISLKLIKKIHQIVFKNSKSFAGKFRSKGIEVAIRDRLRDIVHIGAPSNRVKGLLEELIEWYEKNRGKYHPLVLASVIHNQFEVIHPFQDGNGRVGRLLLNNILIKNRFPPINIGFNNRRDYYAAIQEYQNKGDIRPTIKLLLNEYKNLKKSLGDHKNK